MQRKRSCLYQYSPNRTSKERKIYPKGKNILVVWLVRSPVWIFACLVRWDQVHEV